MGYLRERKQISWTPTVIGSTSAGAGTYTTQQGYWTSLGGILFVQAEVTWTAHTGTGNLLAVLPFPTRNDANYNPEVTIYTENINLPNGTISVLGIIANGSSQMSILTERSNNTLLAMALPASGTLHFTGTYIYTA